MRTSLHAARAGRVRVRVKVTSHSTHLTAGIVARKTRRTRHTTQVTCLVTPHTVSACARKPGRVRGGGSHGPSGRSRPVGPGRRSRPVGKAGREGVPQSGCSSVTASPGGGAPVEPASPRTSSRTMPARPGPTGPDQPGRPAAGRSESRSKADSDRAAPGRAGPGRAAWAAGAGERAQG
jgi:hypothetical protein